MTRNWNSIYIVSSKKFFQIFPHKTSSTRYNHMIGNLFIHTKMIKYFILKISREYTWQQRSMSSSVKMQKNAGSFTQNHIKKNLPQQFGGDFNHETHNREKPISQKTTHLLLYGGLGVVALWIILNEILHF